MKTQSEKQGLLNKARFSESASCRAGNHWDVPPDWTISPQKLDTDLADVNTNANCIYSAGQVNIC